MFCSLPFLLFLFTATNSRPNNFFTNETTLANETNETFPMILTGDFSNVAIQRDNDVQLTGPGTVDLILMDRNLDVDINLNKCSDRVKFCYSSLEKNSEASALCENDFCGFEVDGRSNTEIDLTGQKGLKRKFLDKKCEPIQMQEIKTKYCGLAAESCKPLIGEEDKRITIIVKASSACDTLI
uniref:Uncharacterized protein n=1 Tax=Panagrolaimus sp. PS1159 TaxID=55785 RepID=A0AC35GFA5_9BILA